MRVSVLFMMALGALALSGCHEAAPSSELAWSPEDFPNLLDLRGAPKSGRDLTAFAFSDLGSWAMYGLPPRDDSGGVGSFPGPLLLPEGGV